MTAMEKGVRSDTASHDGPVGHFDDTTEDGGDKVEGEKAYSLISMPFDLPEKNGAQSVGAQWSQRCRCGITALANLRAMTQHPMGATDPWGNR
jgi:hypothetical protein